MRVQVVCVVFALYCGVRARVVFLVFFGVAGAFPVRDSLVVLTSLAVGLAVYESVEPEVFAMGMVDTVVESVG